MTEDCLKQDHMKRLLCQHNVTIIIYGSSDKVSPKLTISNSQCFTKTKQKRPFGTETRSAGLCQAERCHPVIMLKYVTPFSFSDPRQKWGGRHARYRNRTHQTGKSVSKYWSKKFTIIQESFIFKSRLSQRRRAQLRAAVNSIGVHSRQRWMTVVLEEDVFILDE